MVRYLDPFSKLISISICICVRKCLRRSGAMAAPARSLAMPWTAATCSTTTDSWPGGTWLAGKGSNAILL